MMIPKVKFKFDDPLSNTMYLSMMIPTDNYNTYCLTLW